MLTRKSCMTLPDSGAPGYWPYNRVPMHPSRFIPIALVFCLTIAGSTLVAQTSESSRRVGEVTIIEDSPARFTDDDLRTIQALLPVNALEWMKVSHVTNAGSPFDMLVTSCMQPGTTLPQLRRGGCRTFARTHARGAQPSGWQKFGPDENYVVFLDAPARLPLLYPQSIQLTDERLISLDRLLRTKAVTSPTPNLASEIQPWPIRELVPLESPDLRVVLAAQGSKQAQSIRLRAAGNDWEVVEMHPLAIPTVRLTIDGAGNLGLSVSP
jgi:hypothetical protein